MNCPFAQNAIAWLQGLKTEALKQKSLGYMLFLAFGATLLFGFAVFLFDPNVHSFTDGVWFAWVTMTHVGYGDVVPTSFLGRTLACVLILFGLAVLAFLTASFSTILMGREMGGMARDESQILAELMRLHERLDRLEASRLDKTGNPLDETNPPQME
jgi:voltage-gated potassium channel